MFGVTSRPAHTARLSRDLADLYSHDFSCSSSCLVPEPGPTLTALTLNVCIHEGPYKSGHFSFYINIPETYPFRMADVWAKQPIYHPNIDLVSGRVMLPIEWSPVLTLKCLAFAVQMMLLEPSTDNIFNLEACSYYSSSLSLFEQQVQSTLKGGRFAGVEFSTVSGIDCQYCKGKFDGDHALSRFRRVPKGKYKISNYKENDIEFPNLMSLSCGDCEDMKDDSFVNSPIQTSTQKRLSSLQQANHYQSIEPSYGQELNEHYDICGGKENSKYRKRHDDRYDNINEKIEMQEMNVNRRNSRKRCDYDDENRDIEYNNIDINGNNDTSYYNTHGNDFCNEMDNEEQSPFSKKRVITRRNDTIYENI